MYIALLAFFGLSVVINACVVVFAASSTHQTVTQRIQTAAIAGAIEAAYLVSILLFYP